MIRVTCRDGSIYEPIGLEKIEIRDEKLVITTRVGVYGRRRVLKIDLDRVVELRQS